MPVLVSAKAGLWQSGIMNLDFDQLRTVHTLRQRAPLVHNLTSATVANFTANALLALGASPAMVESPDEIPGFVALADALSINLGSLTPARAAAIELAVQAAGESGTPWVLDPVGAGGITGRTLFARTMARRAPAAIRGNASEILGLAGEAGGGRGVDSGAMSEAALDAARRLAQQTGAIVAVTGAVDYVTDGTEVLAIALGHKMMTQVTGMGCAASAIVAACLAVEPDRLRAVAHALTLTGLAGTRAAARTAGPGSLAVAWLDELAAL
jgi:hydroxyethylthiazole kinase